MLDSSREFRRGLSRERIKIETTQNTQDVLENQEMPEMYPFLHIPAHPHFKNLQIGGQTVASQL